MTLPNLPQDKANHLAYGAAIFSIALLAAEVRAYKRQIAVGGISMDAASMMLLRYDLGITQQEAVGILT